MRKSKALSGIAGHACRLAVGAGLALSTMAGVSAAQTLGIGTTSGGATGQIGIAIAQRISEGSDLRALPQVSGNTSQYIPIVDAGRIDLGVANYPQIFYAIAGTGMSSEPSKNLRLVATLMPFLAGLITAEDSGIKTYAEIKDRKVPRYPPNSLGDFVIRATLAAGGLTYDDVVSVPVANFPQQYEAFKTRDIDVSIASVGAQPTFEIESTVGDIQFIPLPKDAAQKMQEFLPGAYLQDIPASETLPGLDEPTTVLAYDYLLFGNANVPDEVIAKVAKSMYEGAEKLKTSSPVWADFDRSQMGKKGNIPYHPGALGYYREVGIAGE